ncbi:MAG: hypothetical protein QOJ68_3893 [Blastococcus sp.]|jgi:hypothetical protein|nr:hypothetical protein [Blastococcus sp.]
MASTAVRFRLGFAVVTALLVAGCGGGTAKNAASTTAASSTTAAASTSSTQATGAALADTPFCQQLTKSMAELTPSFAGGASDPAQLGAAVKKEAELVRSIHPPDEIAADWKTLGTALDALASSYGKLDPHNPASASTFLGQNAAQLGALEAAAAHLGTYLSTKCGITTPTGLPTAPSS